MNHSPSRPTGGTITDVEKRPLISAILVTRNKESYIRECLNGLMEQSVADRMEVIVVDEGSEQAEWSVIADLQRRHKNLISVRTAAAGYSGVDLALRIASGRYLTVLEPTDRLKLDAYELLSAELERNPQAMLAYGDTCFTAIPHESFAKHTSYGKMIWPDYTFQQLTQLSQVAPHPMWRRELHDSLGRFSDGNQGQGMRDFLVRVVERFPMAHIQEFTALKLVPAGAPLNQDASVRDSAPRNLVHQDAAPLHQASQDAVRQPGEAETFYQRALEIEPWNQSVRERLTELRGREAEGSSTEDDEPAEERYERSQSLVAQGDLDGAARELEGILTVFPEFSPAHNDLAVIFYQNGDKDQALMHYEKAAALAPGNSTFQKNLADFYFVEGRDVDGAIAIYLELLRKEPRNVETLMSLGKICTMLDRPQEAETFYGKVTQLEPWNRDARECLSTLRQCANG
jgi:Flp pilus assembly protein TadD